MGSGVASQPCCQRSSGKRSWPGMPTPSSRGPIRLGPKSKFLQPCDRPSMRGGPSSDFLDLGGRGLRYAADWEGDLDAIRHAERSSGGPVEDAYFVNALTMPLFQFLSPPSRAPPERRRPQSLPLLELALLQPAFASQPVNGLAICIRWFAKNQSTSQPSKQSTNHSSLQRKECHQQETDPLPFYSSQSSMYTAFSLHARWQIVLSMK